MVKCSERLKRVIAVFVSQCLRGNILLTTKTRRPQVIAYKEISKINTEDRLLK